MQHEAKRISESLWARRKLWYIVVNTTAKARASVLPRNTCVFNIKAIATPY